MESIEPQLGIHTYLPSKDRWASYRGPEGFSYERMRPEDEQVFLSRYHEAIAEKNRFLGNGNHALVFDLIGATDERPRSCAKLSWEGPTGVTVEVKNRRFELLPPEYQRLRRFQDYFAEVRGMQREQVAGSGGNAYFRPQVDVEQEALAQNFAREALEAAGFPDSVPRANAVLSLEREHEGETDQEGLPFFVSEKAKAILMDRVEGATVQDILLRRVSWWDEVSPEKLFAAADCLERMIPALAEVGLAHNDISNRNVMIRRADAQPVLIDFGKASGEVSSEGYEDQRHAAEVANWMRRFAHKPDATSIDLAGRLREEVAIS